MGMCYLLENSDYRIIDMVFNYFEIYPTLLNMDNLLYIPNKDEIKSIPSFSKKIRSLFDFIIRNEKYHLLNQNNFIKDSLLNFESKIENKNFQPFILPTLYSLNKRYNIRICLDSSLLYHTIHRKYFNKENIIKLIELGNLNSKYISLSKRKRFLCKIIKLNFFSHTKSSSLICFCGLKDIIINMVNYSFGTNFPNEQNKNDGLFATLKYISFTVFEQSHNIHGSDRDIIYKLNKILQLSIKHKCFKNKNTLLKSIVDLVEISTDRNILSTQHFYNLGNIRYLEYNSETFELVKMLTMKNYHISWFDKIYESNKPYYFRSEVNTDFIFKDYYLDTENIKRQISVNNEYKNDLKSIQKNFIGFLRIVEKSLDKYKTLLNTTTKKKVLSNIYDIVNISNSYERKIIELCNCYKYNCQYSVSDYEQFLQDIGFHYTYITFPKTIKKYIQFVKSKIKNMTTFKSKIEVFLNEINIDFKTTNYLCAIFKIKIFVRKRTFNNFINHKSKMDSLFNDILIQKQPTILTEELPTSQEVEDDIVSQLTALLDFDMQDKSSNLVKRNTNKVTKPNLLRFIDILNNYNTHSVITQKIDGVKHTNIRISNCFPIITNNYTFDIEYFEEDNMHFIIGLSKYKVYHETTFTQVMNNLRKQHPYTKGINIPEKISLNELKNSDFKEVLIQEGENYKKYLSDSRTRKFRGKQLWWPKMFYEIDYNSLEEYIEILAFFENNPYLKIFKNDGWIIQHKDYKQNEDTNINSHISFKLKPVDIVTIDLMYKEDSLTGLRCWLYENKGELEDFEKNFNISVNSDGRVTPENLKIYRCYPIINKNMNLYESSENVIINFEQREIRNDRKLPNSINIVDKCITNIKSPLRFENICNILAKDIPYYSKQLPNQQSNRYKKYSSTTSKKLQPFIKGSIIDLGGGFKTKNYLKKFNESITDCISTDCDLNIVTKNIIKQAKTKCEFEQKIKYSYLDFTKSFNDYTGLEKELHLHSHTQKFNTITLFNCINFALKTKNTIKQFFKNINSVSQINTNIIIKFMDVDSFIEGIQPEHDNSIVLNSYYDSSFININFKTMTNRIYYEWAHAFPIEEKIIGRKELTNLFEINGWECVYYNPHEKYDKVNNKMDSLWEHYFYSFSDIVFKYNGVN